MVNNSKKRRKSVVIQLAEVRTLRRKETYEEGELEDFFRRRDEYIARFGGQISDFMELSPMALCRRWTQDLPPEE